MRKANPAFMALAALVLLATPALAKSTKAQKADTSTETGDTPPPCFSYQLGPDGNWAQRPCDELGTHSSSQHRAPSKNHDQEAH
jgi:hypothetical protein